MLLALFFSFALFDIESQVIVLGRLALALYRVIGLTSNLQLI